MEDLIQIEDPVTIFLVLALLLLVVVPGVLLLLWRVTRLPFKAESLRWAYLGWALLLAASSVWNLTRNVRYSVEEAGADNFLRLGFLALGLLIVMFIGFKHRLAFVSELFYGVLGIFFVFSLWGAMSVTWSVAPAVTLYKSLEYCAMLLLLALTVSLIRHSVREPHNQILALKSVFDWNWFLVFLLLVSVYVGILVWPEYGMMENKSMLGFSIEGALPGISANGVGQLAAILGLVAFVRLLVNPQSRKVYLPLLAFSLVTMVLAQSRSPILAFVVAAFVVLVASRRYGLGRGFSPADRSPHEGHRQRRQQTGLPINHEGHVANQVEADPPVQRAGGPVGAELPEVVVELLAPSPTRLMVPSPYQVGQFVVDGMQVGHGVPG